MKALLDTHTLLWALLNPDLLSEAAKTIIGSEANSVAVSAASAWEIATKVRIGKLPYAAEIERDFLAVMDYAGYTLLPIEVAHALRAGRLPSEHRDPFDRMIAAQAIAHDLAVLSNDTRLDAFGVRRIW